jgi:hypothetical protein
MLGFGKRGQLANSPPPKDSAPVAQATHISTRLCTDHFNGKYPHVGIYDCRERKIWVCKPLKGQAIRTSHARLITGSDNAISTAWKDRFLCFWFYTPRTGEGYILGYPIDWEEAHLLIRIDPQWDYDRQRLVPMELNNQINENRERQIRHGERIFDFFRHSPIDYAFNLHYIGQRAVESIFYAKRFEPT